MRLAMKFGVSLAMTTPLPSLWSQNWVSVSITSGLRAGPGNNFDQLQVARRVKEMRAGPVLLPFLGQALGDAAHGQTGGIRGDDGAGLANLRDAREQRALDLEIFRDDFDDPVRFGAEFQIVFEIAGDDAIFEAAREKCRGLGFCGGGKARAHDAVADFGTCDGQARAFFPRR